MDTTPTPDNSERPVKRGRGRPPKDENQKAWESGTLRHLLRPNQAVIYDTLINQSGRKTVLHCSRRFGKSFFLIVAALEKAIQTPNAVVSYVCPTYKEATKIVRPIMRVLLESCPDTVKPTYKRVEGIYEFPNGSKIHLAGSDNEHADNLRGQSADLVIVDEAGFCTELGYLVESILMPQLLTTGGKLLLSSTSPKTPDHPFVSYIETAILEGYYHKFTLDQAGYPQAVVDEMIKEAGGRESTACRREYFCELVVDDDKSLCPEWRLVSKACTRKADRDDLFQFYLKFFCVDSGVRDSTVGLHAYYDFKRAVLFVEREFVLRGPEVRTDRIAALITQAETDLGYHDVARYADSENAILIQDLTNFHNVPVMATKKDSLEAMVNQVRLWVKDSRVVIDPSCLFLLMTLRSGTWNNQRNAFARSTLLYHMDAFAALMYLVRMVQTQVNPVPNHLGLSSATHHLDTNRESGDVVNWRNILNLQKDKEEE